jgi:hypothetical protein
MADELMKNKYLEKIAAFNTSTVKKTIDILKGKNIIKARDSRSIASRKAEHFSNIQGDRNFAAYHFRKDNPNDIVGIAKKERAYNSANKARTNSTKIAYNRSFETNHQFDKSLSHAKTLGAVTGSISGGISGATAGGKDHRVSGTLGGAILGGVGGSLVAGKIADKKYLKLYQGK